MKQLSHFAFFLVCMCMSAWHSIFAASQSPLVAEYSIDDSWPTGYQVTVTLTNNSTTACSSWTASFSLTQSSQYISSFWNGEFTANGQNISIANPTWIGGGDIPSGGSTTFGMIVQNPDSGSAFLCGLQAAGSTASAPVPTAPVLNAISVNSSTSNDYTVSWIQIADATQYTLEQDVTESFSNPTVIVQGDVLSQSFTNQANGTYYYRVSATDVSGTSPYSNIQSVVINMQPSPPQSSPFVEGYWESWNSNDAVSTIVNMDVNVIDIAFANFKTTGTHTYQIAGIECDQATLTNIVTLAHNAGKKIKISVGGATYPLSPQLQTLQDAAGMAQAIAQFVQQNSLDGVDFDIEDYPAPNLQTALIQNTRQLLGNKALISYTAKSPASSTYPYDNVIQSAYSDLSYVQIMAYDYGYSSYSYEQDAMGLMNFGVPASKIIIGLMPGYDDLNELTSVSDISTAANYILSNGLGGIMFWDLNRDLENLTGLGKDAATMTAWNILH